MVSVATAVIALGAYVVLLFVVAEWGEKTATGKRVAGHPVVFSLGLAVYCTTWTFYGSVGKAASGGMGYLPVYLGPTLALLFGASVFRRIIALKHAHRLTSIADFISARYGKSQAVAAVVTGALLVGIIPYIALQLKAVAGSFELLTMSTDGTASPYVRWFNPLSAIMLIAFTIGFGIRHLDPTERHPGMVVSVAVESFVKLAAFLLAGFAILRLAFGGVGGFMAALDDGLASVPLMRKGSGNDFLTWITVTLLSMAAFAFLPRQFHQGVIEAGDARGVRTAQWLTPLYLVAINLLVVPIALGGRILAKDSTSADLYVLALPLQAGQSALSIIVFVGGFSAAIGMIMIETMTMATMVSNHLLLPIIQAVARLRFLQRHILYLRWAAAAVVIGGGYGFEVGIGPSYPLVSIGLISFAAAFLLAPLVLGGLFWRGASKGGALMGLGAGFALWFYCLLVPTFVKAGWVGKDILSDGPLGLRWLRPEALLGLEGLPALAHGVMFSSGATLLMYLLGSALFPAGKEERQLTEAFLETHSNQFAHLDDKNATIDAGEQRARMRALFAEFFSEAELDGLCDRCLTAIGGVGRDKLTVVEMAELHGEVERALAGAIGSASAHNVMKRWGTVERKDARTLVHEFARTLAQLKLSPREIKRRIDYQAERDKLLDEQFRQMQGHIDALNLEVAERQKVEAALRVARDQLEARVHERTREIQTILDHVTFGFLVLDRNLVVEPGYTRSCHELFGAGHGRIAGGPLLELLGEVGTGPGELLRLGLEAFFEDFMPEEVLSAQLPHRLHRPDGRVLHIDARMIRDEAGAVDKLLLTISDVSQLEAAEHENERNRAIIGILHAKAAFRRFLKETRDRIDSAHGALSRAGAGERGEASVRRELHTIKGNAAAYGLKDVVALIHDIEGKPHITRADVDAVTAAFEAFLAANHTVLALPADRGLDSDDEVYAVTRDHMSALGAIIERMAGDLGASPQPALAAKVEPLRRWSAEALRRPARALLGPVDDFVAKLADRLGKRVGFVLEGGETLVAPATVLPVLQTIAHLVRNAVDHGIEPPEQRGDKAPAGRLSLTVAAEAGAYRITVEDDGRGIDVDEVGARAVAIGALDAAALARASDQQKLELIFTDGLSTAAKTTDISGRGVGMSAVRAAVEQMGGRIEVASRKGQGTRFVITLPMPPELCDVPPLPPSGRGLHP